MSRPEQKDLALSGGLLVSHARAARELLSQIRHVDSHFAPKRSELIKELPGCRSESHLSEALAGDKNFPVRWLPTYVRYDAGLLIPSEVARWVAHKIAPARPMSDAERVARLEMAMEALGDVGDLVRRRAEAFPDHLFDQEPQR
jgi:hypothetical protein